MPVYTYVCVLVNKDISLRNVYSLLITLVLINISIHTYLCIIYFVFILCNKTKTNI